MKRQFECAHPVSASKPSTIASGDGGHKFARVNAHVDGDWHCFMYCPAKPNKHVKHLFYQCTHHLHQSTPVLTPQLPQTTTIQAYTSESNTHISLCKPFTLKTHQIDTFISLLNKQIHTLSSPLVVHVCPSYSLLQNESKTRWFQCVQIENKNNILVNKIESVNAILAKFQQPPYYSEAKLHISIGSFATTDACVTDSALVYTLPDSTPCAESSYLADLATLSPSSSSSDDDDDDDDSSDDDEDGTSATRSGFSGPPFAFSSTMRLPLSLHIVECKIGHRLFRADFTPISPIGAPNFPIVSSSSVSVQFIEVL